MRVYFSVAHEGQFLFRTDVFEHDALGADNAGDELVKRFPALESFTVTRYEEPGEWTFRDVTAKEGA